MRPPVRPSRRPGASQLFEARCDERRRHGVVGLEKAAREVQPDSLSGGQIDQDRSRVTAKRRAVVQHDVRPRLRHLARREPLLVVHATEDRLHQLVVRNPPVPGGIPDHRDLLRRPGGRSRQRNRRGELASARYLLHAQEREVRTLFVLDVEDLDDLKLESLGAAYFLEEVDGRLDGLGAAPVLEREAAADRRR